MMQPYGRELCDIPYMLLLFTNSMSNPRQAKTVYKIKPKEFPDEVDHHLYPAYVQLARELNNYRTSRQLKKLYGSKSTGYEVIDNIQTRMTEQMISEIRTLDGFKTPRGGGYSRFNEIKDLATTKFFELEEVELVQ